MCRQETTRDGPPVVPTQRQASGKFEADAWKLEGECCVRSHNKPRRQLFTPLRVKGAPPARSLFSIRVTEGVFCGSGERFKKVDSWHSREDAHADLGRFWQGSTTFVQRQFVSVCSKDPLRPEQNDARAVGGSRYYYSTEQSNESSGEVIPVSTALAGLTQVNGVAIRNATAPRPLALARQPGAESPNPNDNTHPVTADSCQAVTGCDRRLRGDRLINGNVNVSDNSCCRVNVINSGL